jgi:S1-C subfamily serine protease
MHLFDAQPEGTSDLPSPPAPTLDETGISEKPLLSPAPSPPVGTGLFSVLVPVSVFLLLVAVTLYTAPYLLVHWRMTEAQAEADAAYLKRRAELKAESEVANQRLQLLDKRVVLTSLGFREVVRKVAPVVVNVANYRTPSKMEGMFAGKRGLLRDADNEKLYVQTGVGSGIIVKPGYVLTNYHVVKNLQRLRVTFASGRSVGEDAEAVVADPVTDLAVIRLSATERANLHDDLNVSAEFADSDKDVQVGDWALAIGSPLGLRQTVTQGVISAKGRLLGMLDLVELLQTDAAINPGNSGGPLFDQYGRVVGINVAIASDTGSNQGIGFAIPSNTAKQIFDQLVSQGEVIRGYLGVALDEVAAKKAKELGLTESGGVEVVKVLPGEAADKAGLLAGDVIVRYRSEVLDHLQPMRQLRQMILSTAPETQVVMEIIRDGEHHTVNVQVGKRPK